MSPYNKEQTEALEIVRRGLQGMTRDRRDALRASIAEYLSFRSRVDRFFETHFAAYCRSKCFQTHMSACCSKEGIVTFFADVVINALVSTPQELERLAVLLRSPPSGHHCVYLGPEGCRWRITPIVCAMFLCDGVKQHAFACDPDSEKDWQSILTERKTFTWPDRPVLFDDLEQVFIDIGHVSILMYLHYSPGMLKVKEKLKIR